jgi:hypothetical protein
MSYFDVPTSQRKSGLLIPSTADIQSANEKIADNYRTEVASFLWTKSRAVDVIKNS